MANCCTPIKKIPLRTKTEYYQDNKIKIDTKFKEFYMNNKDAIEKKKKLKNICSVCSGCYTNNNKSVHIKQRHI